MRIETLSELSQMIGEEKALKIWEEKTRSKYGNKKNVVDNIKFDSIAESNYYQVLKLLKRNKDILDFKLQPKFLLQEKFRRSGKLIYALNYIADFKVTYSDRVEIVDVKGHETQTYKIKRKLFLKKFPEYIFVEIKKGERIEW